eukprot:GILJ01003319.1.p1 GENE.GILJ01003319.1~~GILJ01003319.1.p1  ORF type:complete len:325 (-),score=38.46 GILJ01003319.1:49-1023(-)
MATIALLHSVLSTHLDAFALARLALTSKSMYECHIQQKYAAAKQRFIVSLLKKGKKRTSEPVLWATVSVFELPKDLLKLKLTKSSELISRNVNSNDTDHKVSFANCCGDSFTLYSQILEKTASASDSSNPYLVLADSADLSQMDFSSSAALLERQRAVLKRVTMKKAEFDPFISLRQTSQKWVIMLCHGGYFAGAVYENAAVVEHKTDHRYVVRKKAGGRQVSYDKGGSQPKSAGASMRRYNEDKHQERIAEILQEWTHHIQQAHLIFLHAPGINRQFFFTESSPLRSSDPRLRPVPINTEKPTFTEVQAVFKDMAAVEVKLSL